jgi:enoyl-CoA hydratase/carnithine racemase
MAMQTLLVERDDGVVTVTMNRPEKRNALTTTMFRELRETFSDITDSTEDRVMVLTGAAGAFCAGADLSAAAEHHHLVHMRLLADVALQLHRLPKPSIAKVNGVAIGAGCNLALGCDLVVASEDARFSEIFSRRGLSLDCGGSWLLPRLIGLHRAKELAFFGEILSAKEALELGLVNRVVAPADLDRFVGDWATRLAAGPPLALSMTKTLLNQSSESSMGQALEAEGHCQSVNLVTDDTMEAFQAFLDKREPRFQGT